MMDDVDDNDIHRFFLQCIMNKSVLSQDDANRIIENHSNKNDLSLIDVIVEINKKIRPYQQTIKWVTNDSNGKKELVFLSLGDDEVARGQVFFLQVDLEYFKFLLQDIILSEKKEISGITALNISSKVLIQKFSKTRAQELLDLWCQMRYLKKEKSGGYRLDTKGIHEFDLYFQHNFPNFVDVCFLCKQSAFLLKTCPSCTESCHIHCLKKYLEKISKWPCCKIAYNTNESAINDTQNSETMDDSKTFIEESQVISQESVTSSPENTQPTAGRKRKII